MTISLRGVWRNVFSTAVAAFGRTVFTPLRTAPAISFWSIGMMPPICTSFPCHVMVVFGASSSASTMTLARMYFPL